MVSFGDIEEVDASYCTSCCYCAIYCWEIFIIPWFPFTVVGFFTSEAVLLFSDCLGVMVLSIGVWNV